MKRLVEFQALGLAVVPWSVPEICVTSRGRRFSKRRKKSNLVLGKASLDDWQKHVAGAAREAMATIPRTCGPIKLQIEFYCRTPAGKRHGQLWDAPLRWNEELGEFTKAQPRGKAEADIVNMIKGTEDALQGVVFENDVQTRAMSVIALHGPCDGIRVTVYSFEASDFPGWGNPEE